MEKIFYSYSRETGELAGKSTADESPLEPGVFLFPAFSTEKEPPVLKEKEVAVLINGDWTVAPDYRGVPCYSKETGDEVTIDTFGTLPESLTLLPKPDKIYKWDADKWVEDYSVQFADKLQIFRERRNVIFNKIADIASFANIQKDQATVDKVLSTRELLKDLPQKAEILSANNINELDVALENAYTDMKKSTTGDLLKVLSELVV